MKNRLVPVYLRLFKYAAFMGAVGGIATFIGPPHHGLLKAAAGAVVAAILLGKRRPAALKEFRNITDEITDEIFPE